MVDNLEQILMDTAKTIIRDAIVKGVNEAFMTTSRLVDVKYMFTPGTQYLDATADMIRKSPDILLRECYLLPYYYQRGDLNDKN